jgi:hypothetical protein
MSEHEQQGLAPELQALIQSGRPGPEVPTEQREALLRSLAPFVGPAGGGPSGGDGQSGQPAAPSPASTLAQAAAGSKLAFGVGGLIAGMVLGAAGHAALTESTPVVAPAPTVAAAPIASVSASRESLAPSWTPSSFPTVAEPRPARSTKPVPEVASADNAARDAGGDGAARDDTLRRERQLLDIARTAVARKDGTAALDAVGRHARDFPRGRLTEEREALRVQALLLLGRKDEARERAEDFQSEHPESLMLPGIAPAL